MKIRATLLPKYHKINSLEENLYYKSLVVKEYEISGVDDSAFVAEGSFTGSIDPYLARDLAQHPSWMISVLDESKIPGYPKKRDSVVGKVFRWRPIERILTWFDSVGR